MIAALWKNVPAAIVALVGVAVAWAWYQAFLIAAIAVGALILIAIGAWLARRRGASLVRGESRDPVGAVPLLEAGAAVDLAAGALASAILIVAAVWLASQTPQGTPEVQKQLLTAAAGAITALITAAFVKNVDDPRALLANPVESEFRSAYDGCYPNGSTEWRAVYDPNFEGDEGWGAGTARRKRAQALAGKPCREA